MKANIRPDGSNPTQNLDYLYESYRPRRRPVLHWGKIGDHKWVIQLLVSGGILLVVLGLFRTSIPFTGSLKNSIRYMLTSETDFRPIYYRAVEFISQAGGFNWPLPGSAGQPSKPAAADVSSGIVLSLPVSGNIIRTYGWETDQIDGVQRFHQGIDISAKAGTGIKSSTGGMVVNIGETSDLGLYVLMKSGSAELVRYANLAEVFVHEGQPVNPGDIIAKLGTTADRQPHLHFEVIVNGRPVDPLDKLGIDFSRLDSMNRLDVR